MATSSILAKIGLNSAGFKTGLAQCRMAAGNFKKSVGGMFSGIGSQILGALGVSAGIAGISALTQKAIEFGGHIEDMANQLRMGKSEFQALAYAAKLAGVEESKLVQTLQTLNQRTIDACDGNDTYRDALNRLGIDLKNFANQSPEKRFEMLGRAFKNSGESLTALNDISTILGQKTAPQLLEVLDKVATQGMESITQSAIEAGNVMDEETLAALARAGDEIDKWQNRIIVGFGGFLADIASAIGRQKWGLLIGMKFAQAGEFIEEALRDISNYILAVFSSVFRYVNGAFSGFVVPIRNAFVGFIETVGSALGKFVGMFSESWQNAINGALDGLRELKDEANRLSAKDKNKSFGQIFAEEVSDASNRNNSRNRQNLLTSKSVDWYKEQLKYVEQARDAEKQLAVSAENARKAKYRKADESPEIKKSAKERRLEKSLSNHNDSSLAKIGGGGLLAARYDITAKQLSESKRQSKLLQKIAENTERQSGKSELLMK